MKKFLGKKWVMIMFVALAAVLFAFTLHLACRPVSRGLAYNSEAVMGGVKVKVEVTFKGSNKMVVKESSEGMSVTGESYYLSKGNKFDSFNSEIAYNAAKANKNYFETNGTKISAFSFEMLGEKFTCVGAIVLVCVGAVLTLATGAFAVLSVMENKKHKK